MAETLWVKSGHLDNRVALHERDDAHPGGEVFVKGDGQPVEVGDTPEVHARIARGLLVKADAPKNAEPKESK